MNVFNDDVAVVEVDVVMREIPERPNPKPDQRFTMRGCGGFRLFHIWSNEPIVMLAKIIEQGQREGDIHEGDPYKMAISYWGLVFAISHNYISSETLEWYDFNMLNRLLIKNI